MSMWDELIGELEADQVAGTYHREGTSGTTSTWPDSLHPSVIDALSDLGIATPWEHQRLAIEAINTHRHTVVATGTGSGKSLTAWAPILSSIASHEASTSLATITRKPTALYLAPTKALAADQYESLTNFLGAARCPAHAAIIDGDAPTDTRRWARDHARIVLSNPDFTHAAILAGHERWSRFLAGLTHIVIDEFHTYRGTTGANMALATRRLLRIARHYGAEPTVIFLSATSAEPGATAARFLGVDPSDIAVIDTDTSSSSPFDLLIARPKRVPGPAPDILTTDGGQAEPRRSSLKEAALVTAHLVDAGARTLVFARSRSGTETLAELINDALEERGSRYAGAVSAYRGGYLPEERRSLEAMLRTGQIRALATTNALELGIDISGLDAVVLAGWPGTHASFRQQLGRAGRSGHPGLGVFITRDDPLDEFYATNSDLLQSASVEHQVFDPTNEYVRHGHIAAAAAEIPLTAADAAVFSLPDTALFDEFVDAGLFTFRDNRWRWNVALGFPAHDLVDLRGSGTEVSIIDGPTGTLLGTVSSEQADRTVYPEGIYIHRGAFYRVTRLEEDQAIVEPYPDQDIRTFAVSESDVEITAIAEARELDNGYLARGEVTVSSRITGYDIRRREDGMYLGRVGLEMPVRTLATSGCWWTLSESTCTAAGLTPDILPGALHAFEHCAIGLLPLFATCDRWDIGGLSTARHGQTEMPTIFVHDGAPGGSGCAERGYQKIREWIGATVERLETCQCREGCPSCIQSPKCGNGNSPLSKTGALLLGRALVTDLGRVG